MARPWQPQLVCEEEARESASLSRTRTAFFTAADPCACCEAVPAQPWSAEQRTRAAVLQCFQDPVPESVGRLLVLSAAEWQRLLSWLDVSGLALYLLDRMSELELLDSLPQWVVEELQQRARENADRTAGMIQESLAIQREFQSAGVSYAVLKGISLSPVSVPRPELRHQFDLDYLVAQESAPEARQILERRGYHLFADGECTWEFKIHETPNVSRRDLYKDLPYRSVELHLEAPDSSERSLLGNIRFRQLHGIEMPVLSPVDLFLGQAMHVFKDVCSAFARTAHILELYRHVLTRRADAAFWHELRAVTKEDRRARLGIGVMIRLLTAIMNDFAPEELTAWTCEALPPSLCLWVDLYGVRAVLASEPGTKLYLLLQRELEACGVESRRRVKTSLWPSRLPPPVIRGIAGERFATRLRRYRVQLRYVASRLRFHLVEGLRYAVESHRWQRRLARLS